jgi:hypothetical protein
VPQALSSNKGTIAITAKSFFFMANSNLLDLGLNRAREKSADEVAL